LAARQLRSLRSHTHAILEDSLAASIAAHLGPVSQANFVDVPRSSGRLNIGFVTPWVPQPSGVADFSAASVAALARLADVTVYTTSVGQVSGSEVSEVAVRNVDVLLESGGEHPHDILVVVAGNSHFHLPLLEVQSLADCVVIAHDTRMVEFYLSLRDRGGVEQVMLKTADPFAPKSLVPPLDDQIADMRLLQNAGMWEIARRSSGLVLHAKSAAERIRVETGVSPHLLPFANQRVPESDSLTVADRVAARSRLGFGSDSIHIASFGYVDTRTKMSDHVLEAAGWLTSWGHKVSLHFVGAAPESVVETLGKQAEHLGLYGFTVTGFVNEVEFRDYLLAVDLGVQLRISPLLGVSGPLSDLAAFGTPSVASAGLAIDVDAPAFIHRLPEDVSALVVAEAIESVVTADLDLLAIEEQRVAYLAGNTPELYAQQLLTHLNSIVGVN
jgi:glycosyltransferase involved in cell wall biosynthesis